MGKNLAFADIQKDDNDKSAIVEVIFHRQSPFWNSLRDDTFPTKPSSLPYGARVSFDLIESDESRLLVREWEMLVDPRQVATDSARMDEQAIFYSKYLKARGDVYSKLHGVHYQPKRKKDKTLTIQQDYCHGDRKAKALRSRLFASWLLETFGKQLLSGGVLDVAGGKGQLSIELAVLGQIPCTIVDPLIRKRPLPAKQRKRIERAQAPPPKHIANFFKAKDMFDCQTLVEDVSCLVGLHPDESTEDILDVALRFNKSVAIVPCCVFSGLFPKRSLHCGRPVGSYEEFIEYLLQKDDRLKKQSLLFEGKNQVIYYKADT